MEGITQVTLGTQLLSEVTSGEYKRYSVSLPPTTHQSLCIKVDPLDSNSDPDVYVTVQGIPSVGRI